jgi:tryptophan-rich sensory protein
VWTLLYFIIAVTFVWIFYLAYKKNIPALVAVPFILNLIFNFAFTPLQFGLQNNYLAAIDVLLVLGTLIWAMKAIWPYSRRIAYWQIPYLAWVAFATILQLTITWLNR